ncbi:hypothetical protein KFL_010960010, partial [Klebsormidium nitens]
TADSGGQHAHDDSLDFTPEARPSVIEVPSRAQDPAIAPINAPAADPVLEKYCSQLLSKCRELPPGLPLSEDSQGQAAFCVPAVSFPSGEIDWTRFEFPGLKMITLRESGSGAVWWCSCSDDLVLQRSLFEGLSKTAMDRTFLAGLVGQCYHLKVLLRIGSTLGLQIEDLCRRQVVIPPAVRVAELEIDSEADGERLVIVTSVPLPWSGKDGLPIVLVGCASRGYAVVRQTTRGTWACTTCSGSGRIKCWHVQAQVEEVATGSVPSSRPGLTAAEFEERLRRALDLSTGMRRLTCLSRVQIPEPHLIGPELADVLKRRGALDLRFPLRCSIRSELRGAQCGCGRSWEEAEKKWVPGTIFHLTAPVTTEVEEWTCPCGGKKHYDGASEGLLNFSNVYLFSYELLNWYSHQFWRTKLPFFSMWSTQVSMYAGIGLSPDLVKRYANMRAKFQDAWLDYISLQRIDYRTSYSCKCRRDIDCGPDARPEGEPEEVTADGVLLGFNSNFSYLVQPWTSPASEPLVSGSLHTDRILVKAAPARQLLLRFSKRSVAARGAGLSDAEYVDLRTLITAEPEASAVDFLLTDPLVDKDRHFARPELREFLHAVASPAPTCSLLPASVFAIVEDHLLVHGHISDFQAYQKFASDASVLHTLVMSLQKQADGKLDRAAIELLSVMLAVARRAFQPAVQRSMSQTASSKEPALSEHPDSGSPNGPAIL